jgi:hypothetical protein
MMNLMRNSWGHMGQILHGSQSSRPIILVFSYILLPRDENLGPPIFV